MKNALALCLLIVLAACGGGSSPAAPTPTTPNVAGSYSGTFTITLPELSTTMSCPATTTVTQSGATVNIAPIVLSGQCSGLSIPIGSATIDTTGALANETGSYYEPSCGGTYNYTGSGGSFGRNFQFSISMTSAVCYNMNITGTLTRA